KRVGRCGHPDGPGPIPGHRPGPAGQETVRVSPLAVTVMGLSPRVAGPVFTAPVLASKLLPWPHGVLQVMVPSATRDTRHPSCGQTALNALNSPSAGWVTTTRWAALMTPPPTGTSETE